MENLTENNAEILKQTAAAKKEAEHYRSAAAGVAGLQQNTTWLNNNNNETTLVGCGGVGSDQTTTTAKITVKEQQMVTNAQKVSSCESCEAVGGGRNNVKNSDSNQLKGLMVVSNAGKETAVELEHRVDVESRDSLNQYDIKQNGTAVTISQNGENCSLAAVKGIANAILAQNDIINAAVVDGAASLTPPDVMSCAGGLDVNSQHSNRTSINNSTENLSYSSDNNYYPDDLLLLDDDDVEAEKISLNSDDCVYAYRGSGADFDLTLDPITGRRCGIGGLGDAGLLDDETDFLEMDFEPDPLSEADFGGCSVESGLHVDAFLLQRDSCHLSGRHSANILNLHGTASNTATTPIQRQLFSSPIDDLPPPPKALQTQSLLIKNFARITLHLDQIKGENGMEADVFERARNERALCTGSSAGNAISDMVDFAAQSTAHSLPNTLHASFGRDAHEKTETKTSPAKITGAKPKRLSTFSTSSSTSSKNSSKSRTSLRSAFAPPLCGSSSFDERSVSCSEFPSAPPEDGAVPTVAPNPSDDFGTNDETCLDCSEKEFLADTIGKARAPNDCPKCRKRSVSISYYARAEQARCRSGSPSFFNEVHDDYVFETACEFSNTHKRGADWAASAAALAATPTKNNVVNSFNSNSKIGSNGLSYGRLNDSIGGSIGSVDDSDDIDVLLILNDTERAVVNQRRTCDNYGVGEHRLKNLLRTEQEIITISTLNLNEEILVQALEKLHVSFNGELLKTHFKHYASPTPNMHKSPQQEYKSFKHFILHESKRNCNHPKLKRLIELATRQQVTVQFKKDTNLAETEFVAVKVVDILHQWTRTKNLELLKQLDKRFMNANVLGKIANIIRQAQQRCTTRRPLPEYITIPQYYPSGFLTLTKKC